MKKLWYYITIFFSGAFMSISDVIPGFSGGIALTITGKLKEVWNTSTKVIKPQKKWERAKAIFFYFVFISGAITGVFGFAQIIKLMLENIPAITFWFFITLTIGSVFVFYSYNKIQLKDFKDKKKKKISILGIITGFSIILVIILVTYFLEGTFTLKDLTNKDGNTNINGIGIKVLICVAGFVGAAAMVTPGVSGALLILMLGAYGYIYDGLYANPSDHSILLVVYMISTAFGSVFSVIILSSLYKKFEQFMNWLFIGTIISSIIGMIWLFNSILIPDANWKWALIGLSVGSAITINWLVIKFKK